MRVNTLTPVVPAAPGETARCRVRVVNDGTATTSYRVRVVGFDGDGVAVPLAGPVPPGHATDVDVDIDVPDSWAVGNHTLALEVSSTRHGERSRLTDLMLCVDSTERVVMTVEPSMLKGRRSTRFRLYVDNREAETVDLRLAGNGPQLRVRLDPARVVLRPGERARIKGSVKGAGLWVRDPIQHVVTFEAAGGAVPVYATAAFRQHPVLPRRLRSGFAVFALLGLWVGIAAGAVLYFRHLDKNETPVAEQTVTETTTPGVAESPSGVPGDAGTEGSTDGAAEPGATPDEAGEEDGATEGPADPKPTLTAIGGKVKAGKTGDDVGVIVKLAPRQLGAGAPPEGTKVVGLRKNLTATKVWPARYGRFRGEGLPAIRQTESIAEGIWAFPDVAIRDTYEVSFSKNGFDTQSFIVIPTEDGKPVELEVDLQPGSGKVEGTVTGPGGPLGDVDIVVTDGTLTYTTTSSTASGSVGEFKIAGVSTPGKYTLSATRRGFGTEVLQIPLSPGEDLDQVRVTLVPGVGSINGTVAGGGVDKATVTASTADISRSTSTLTQTPVGSYHIPQLPIPGGYTVTAEAAGFTTQTRLVSLNGNVSSVDFNLVKTTGTITGLATSDTKGALTGAAVTISRDGLAFKTTTAVSPDAGSFTVEDLPPGEYVVEIADFEHVPVSQIVSLTAGEVRSLGTIQLTYQKRGLLAQTGELEISLFDTANAEVKGATVTMVDVTDGTVFKSITDTDKENSTFRFSPVDVGTYSVEVERDGYQSATQRVSIGLGTETRQFNLLRLGRATGTVVDSLTGEVLSGYQVTIKRVLPNGTTLVVHGPLGPTDDPLRGWEWQTSPNSLVPGTYRVEIVAPQGYAVAGDQVIDPEASPRLLTFIVPAEEEGQITTSPVAADPYPKLSGRLFIPTFAGATQVGFGEVGAAPTVELRCPIPDTSDFTPWIPATSLDDNVAPFPGIDGYTFSRDELWQTANGLGACTLRVSLAGFQTVTVPLATPLAPSDGLTSSDQFVSVALLGDLDSLGGMVYWLDRGVAGVNPVYLDLVEISTVTPVITDFAAGEGGTVDTAPTPIFATEPLSSSSDDGVWILAGQVFGQTTYRFVHPQTNTGTLTVKIDEQGRTVSALGSLTLVPNPQVELNPLDTLDPVDVELLALPGSLTGQVTLLTTDLTHTPNFAGVGIAATGPGGAGTVVQPTTPDGSFTVNPAAAGMWQVAFTEPDHFSRLDGAESPVQHFVDPVAPPASGFDTTFYELGDISVIVTDSAGGTIVPLAPIQVDVDHVDGGAGGEPDSSTATVNVEGTLAFFVDQKVNDTTPLATKTRYTVSTTVPGYDNAKAEVTITDASGTAVPFDGSTGIPVDLRAGTHAVVEIKLPKQGAIIGSVRGQVGANSEALGEGSGVVVTATRVFAPDQVPVSGEPAITATLTGETFSVSGLPGYYRIDITHPSFETTPLTVPTPDFNTAYLMTNTIDNPLDAPFLLAVRRGALDVRAVTSTGTMTPIPGAAVEVRRPGTTDADTNTVVSPGHGLAVDDDVIFRAPLVGGLPGGLLPNAPYFVLADGLTTSTFKVSETMGGTAIDVTTSGALLWFEPVTLDLVGHAVIGDLVPGSYTVSMYVRDTNGADLNFPVLVSITIPRTTGAPPTVTLLAPMPEVRGTIEGRIRAINWDGDEVSLPPFVTIDRAYPEPELVVNGTNRPNVLDETNLSTSPVDQLTVVPGSPNQETPQTFTFRNLARGEHTLTFSTPGGYTGPSPNPRQYPVTGIGATAAGAVTYRAEDVEVTVIVRADDATTQRIATPVTTARVRLVSPDPGEFFDARPGSTPGEYVFDNIPPEMLDYHLTIDDNLYLPYQPPDGAPVPVRPDADGTLSLGTVFLTPDVGRISGVLKVQDAAGTASTPWVGVGTVTLYKQTQSGLVTPVLGDTGTGGVYQFDVLEEGTYVVVGNVSGYAPRPVTAPSVELGKVTDAPLLVLPKLAKAKYRILGPLSTDPSLRLTVTLPVSSSLTATRSDNVFTVSGLDPDVEYRFQASATHWYTQDVPSATGTLDPAIGANPSTPTDVTLLQRVVQIRVETPGNITADEAAATFTVFIPAGTSIPFRVVRSGNNYEIRDIPDAAGTITVRSPGYLDKPVTLPVLPSQASPVQDLGSVTLDMRTVNVTVSSSPTNNTANTGATVSLTVAGNVVAAPVRSGNSYLFDRLPPGQGLLTVSYTGYRSHVDVDIGDVVTRTPSVVLLPLVTISGTVTDADGNPVVGATVAFSDGRTTPTVALGFYTLGGFDLGEWTVSADVDGEGYRQRQVDVTASSTTSPDVDLQLVPDAIEYSFDVVTSPSGAAAVGALVSFPSTRTDDTGLTDAGEVTLTTTEDKRVWTITLVGFFPVTGTAPLVPTGPISVTLYPLATVSGTVVTLDGGGADVLEPGIPVFLCRGHDITSCNNSSGSLEDNTTSAAATAVYSFAGLSVGDYTIRARRSSSTNGYINISVDDHGLVTPSATGLRILMT